MIVWLANWLLHFNSVAEGHSADHFGEPFETPQPPPTALGAHAELEDHREHSVARQAPFGSVGTVAHGRKGGLDGVGGSQVNPVLGREVVEGEQLSAVLGEALDRLGVLLA